MIKTAEEMKEESMDVVFAGIKKEKRDELLKNLMELRRISHIMGISIKTAGLINYYLEDAPTVNLGKIMGIDFSNQPQEDE